MASMNGNDSGSSRSPETVICEALTVIKNDKNAADSLKTAGDTLHESKKTERGYKICCLDRAQESNDFYQDVMTCVTIENFKKTEIAQINIDAYVKKDDEIEKLIKESSKLLNEMHLKLADANNAACALQNCVKSKIYPKSVRTTKGSGDTDKESAKGILEEILIKTKTLAEKGQNAFESVVTIAGIQTFTNTLSLKTYAILVLDAMKPFKDCVDTNIKSTGEEVVTSRSELNVVIEEMAQVICDKNAQSTTSQGLECMIEFICVDKCDDGCLDLCEDFEECCVTNDDDEGEEYSGKQSPDQN